MNNFKIGDLVRIKESRFEYEGMDSDAYLLKGKVGRVIGINKKNESKLEIDWFPFVSSFNIWAPKFLELANLEDYEGDIPVNNRSLPLDNLEMKI